MVIPTPGYNLLRNNVNITNQIKKYLLGITVEDIFDANFSPSKLELYVNPNYPYSWAYNDKLFVNLYWNQFPNSFVSDDFYVDYYDDYKNLSNQSYTVSGIEQDLTLSETFKDESIVYNNTTILMALQSVTSARGLTLSQNATSNVYLGTLSSTSQISTVTKKYSSYLDVVRDICDTYGYIGNLSGKNLEVYRLNNPATVTAQIPTPSSNRVLNIQARNQVNIVAKQYNARFIDRSNGNIETILNLVNPSGVSNKIVDLSSEGIYYNRDSAYERTVGRLYQDYYKSFTIKITYFAREYLVAGKYFYLDSYYGSYSGYYIALKVTHKMTNDNWLVDVEAFPMKVLQGINSTFQIYPLANGAV